ncbi:MAG: hypothetical protein ACUZ8H_16085 [Candidatus Anammoxibacter sp.]
MAASSKPVQSEEVVVKGVFDPTIKNADEVLKKLKLVVGGFKAVLKVSNETLKQNKDPKTAKQISLVTKELDRSTTARKGLIEAEKQEVVVKKKLKELTVAEIKDKLKVQARNKAIRDSLKDIIILEQKQVGTLQRISIENKKLRKERDRLNLNTKIGVKRLKEINIQLDKNNKKVVENSDKLKKQRLNVGNYTDSIKEAAGASGLFGGVLGKLSAIQGVLSALTKKNTAEQAANTVSKEATAVATVQLTVAQRGLTTATAVGTKGLRLFKIALLGTGIGILLIALGSLVAFFTRSQEGIDGLSKGFAGLSTGIDVILDRFQRVGEGLALFFKGITNFDSEKIADGLSLIKNAFNGITAEINEEVKIGIALKGLLIDLTREQKLFEAEQAATLTTIKELTVITKNKLALDRDRLDAVRKINELEIQLAEKQLDLQEKELAGAFESLSADHQRLELTKEEIKFVDDLKNGLLDINTAATQARELTLGRAKAEESLFNIIDKIIAQEQARQELLDKQATTAKRTASIVQLIANKQATAFLQQAAAQREIAKDADLIIEERIEAFNRARDFETNAFRARFQANLILQSEFEAARFRTAKVAEANIQRLLDKVASDRLKAIQAAQEARLKGLEDVAKDRENEVKTLETQLFKLETLKIQGLDNDQEIADKEFEIEKTKLDNIKNSQLNSAEEIAQAQAEFDRFIIDKAQETADKLAQIEAEKRKNAIDELVKVTSAVGVELDKRSSANQSALDAEIKRNLDAISTQQQLAKEGKDNQLAFEEQQLAQSQLRKRELEEKAAKETEALQLVEAYFNALNAELSKKDSNPSQAPAKALSTVLLAKVIAKGIVQVAAEGDDYITPKGVGGKRGVDDIPFYVTEGEAIIKRTANVGNPGVSKSLNDGTFTDMYIPRFMTNEAVLAIAVRKSKEPSDPTIKQNEEIKGLLVDIKSAIKSQPRQQVNVDELGNLIETVYINGRKEVIKYMHNRKRLR